MALTCNKKAYEKFRKECEKCSEYEECKKNGKFVQLALADMPTMPNGLEYASKNNRTTTISNGQGFNYDISMGSIEKSISKQLYSKQSLLMNGA